jgi:hypothetical protein
MLSGVGMTDKIVGRPLRDGLVRQTASYARHRVQMPIGDAATAIAQQLKGSAALRDEAIGVAIPNSECGGRVWARFQCIAH